MGIQSKLKALRPTFSPALRRIAGAVSGNTTIVLEATISNSPATCDTSVASVVRFCRAVSASGYGQLCMSLAAELGKESEQFGPGFTLGA